MSRDQIVYTYDRKHTQDLVYVAMSRASSLEGLHIISKNNGGDTFHHARGYVNHDLRSEFARLKNNALHTVGEQYKYIIQRLKRHHDALTLITLNVQSLKAHTEDIVTDSVLSSTRIMALTETWTDNHTTVAIPGFRQITQSKRETVKAGGVAIYENEDYLRLAAECELVLRKEMPPNVCGDICSAEVTIDGTQVLLVALYISGVKITGYTRIS